MNDDTNEIIIQSVQTKICSTPRKIVLQDNIVKTKTDKSDNNPNR